MSRHSPILSSSHRQNFQRSHRWLQLTGLLHRNPIGEFRGLSVAVTRSITSAYLDLKFAFLPNNKQLPLNFWDRGTTDYFASANLPGYRFITSAVSTWAISLFQVPGTGVCP